MRVRKSGRLLPFCKGQAAPLVAPALDGEKPIPATPARAFFHAAGSAATSPLAWLRQRVFRAPLSPTALQGSRKQTPLRSVPWPGLLREGGRFPIPLSLPILPARRASSRRRVLPARREKFHPARAFPGSAANPRPRFPAAKNFPSEIFRLFR